MDNELSNGQIRVREIVSEYVPIYQELRLKGKNLPFGSLINERRTLYAEIRNRFKCDEIITSDSITTQRLDSPSISDNYLTWLNDQGKNTYIRSGFPKVKLDRIVYGHETSEPAYLGGLKWDQTFSVLLGIANGDRIDTNGWESSYYLYEGIWGISGGGRHRQLAHVLFGEPNVSPQSMYVTDDKSASDKLLHSALLEIEKFYREIAHSFSLSYEPSRQIEEAELIKHFISETSLEERQIIKDFCFYQKNKYGNQIMPFSFRGDISNIESLMRLINDIKVIQGKSKIYKFTTRILNKFNLSSKYLDPLEKWMLGICKD